MGPPGSGKTTFINVVSGSNLHVGESLQSGTNKIQVAPPFQLHGKWVRLIDVPGFEGSSKNDTEILAQIATFFAKMYEQGRKLSGIIYMQRISDVRMNGISKHNLNMFRKLCGDSMLKNAVIVTGLWGEVAEAQEAELENNNAWFKPILDKGALLFRHHNDVQSAQAIIHSIIENQPHTLRIQHEIVGLGKANSQTAAGEELNRMLRRKDRPPYICDICGASFTAKHNLRNHVNAHNLNSLGNVVV
ncbi:hypothetical protein B0H13DRAFT_2188386 [Mycena leptocephala]|nr:hypothetical protein B0H13DRAFT_2188386 [Mycena leptocephala]